MSQWKIRQRLSSVIKLAFNLRAASPGNDGLTRMFQNLCSLAHASCYLGFPLNYFSASTVQKYAQKNPVWLPKSAEAASVLFCSLECSGRLQFLFVSYNKIAANGNDSKMVVCSQRLTCQNIEGADFCSGSSAAPFVPTGTSSSPLWKQVSFLPLLKSMYPVWPLFPCFLFPTPVLPTEIQVEPQHG